MLFDRIVTMSTISEAAPVSGTGNSKKADDSIDPKWLGYAETCAGMFEKVKQPTGNDDSILTTIIPPLEIYGKILKAIGPKIRSNQYEQLKKMKNQLGEKLYWLYSSTKVPVETALADANNPKDEDTAAAAKIFLKRFSVLFSTVVKNVKDRGDSDQKNNITFGIPGADGGVAIFNPIEKFEQRIKSIDAVIGPIDVESDEVKKDDILHDVFGFGKAQFNDVDTMALQFDLIMGKIGASNDLPPDVNKAYIDAMNVFGLKKYEELAKKGPITSGAPEEETENDQEPTATEQEVKGSVEASGGKHTYELDGLSISVLKIGVTTFMNNFTYELTQKEGPAGKQQAQGFGIAGMLRNAKMTVSDLIGYDMPSDIAHVVDSYSNMRRTIANAMKKSTGVAFSVLGVVGGIEGMKKMYNLGNEIAGVPLKEIMESSPEDLNTHIVNMENWAREKSGLPQLDASSDVYAKYASRYRPVKYKYMGSVIERDKDYGVPTKSAVKPTPNKPVKPTAVPKSHAQAVNASLEYGGSELSEDMAPGVAMQTPASVVQYDSMTAPSRSEPVQQTGMFNMNKKKKKKKAMAADTKENMMDFDTFVNEYYEDATDIDVAEGLGTMIMNFFKGLFAHDYESDLSSLIGTSRLRDTLGGTKTDNSIINVQELGTKASDVVLDELFKKMGGGQYLRELINQLKIQLQAGGTGTITAKDNARKLAANKSIAANLKLLTDKANAAGDAGLEAMIDARKKDAAAVVAVADQVITNNMAKQGKAKQSETPEQANTEVQTLINDANNENNPNNIKAKVNKAKAAKPAAPKQANTAAPKQANTAAPKPAKPNKLAGKVKGVSTKPMPAAAQSTQVSAAPAAPTTAAPSK